MKNLNKVFSIMVLCSLSVLFTACPGGDDPDPEPEPPTPFYGGDDPEEEHINGNSGSNSYGNISLISRDGMTLKVKYLKFPTF